jgi:hypothetical protein
MPSSPSLQAWRVAPSWPSRYSLNCRPGPAHGSASQAQPCGP